MYKVNYVNELCQHDIQQEVKTRSIKQTHFTQNELIQLTFDSIKILALLEANGVHHS